MRLMMLQDEKANEDLVQSWLDRLQLISVIVSFKYITDVTALLLKGNSRVRLLSLLPPKPDCFQTTSANSGNNTISPVLNAANAGILGALIIPHLLVGTAPIS